MRQVKKTPPEGCSFSHKCSKCGARKSMEAQRIGSTRIASCAHCGPAQHTCLPVDAKRKPQGNVYVKKVHRRAVR